MYFLTKAPWKNGELTDQAVIQKSYQKQSKVIYHSLKNKQSIPY